MWVNREHYIDLRAKVAAQSQTIELLRVRLNELAEENAYLKGEKLGIPPVRVPVIDRVDPAQVPSSIVANPKVKGRAAAPPPSLADLTTGNIGFEDMGDEAARRAGIAHDDNGHVIYG
jgi:hypothetical protein